MEATDVAAAPYRDPAVAVEKRVADLLARMTLEEKAAQLSCAFAVQSPDALEEPSLGLGGVAWLVAAGHHEPREAARATNAMQARLAAASRHGIPALLNEEALCGLKVRGATIFPDAIGQAATWDPALVEEMARAIGRHMSAIGVRQALSPLCDVVRDPRWGRVEETYGEDPYLVGCIAVGYVRGLQAAGHVATLKHFVTYAASEGGRNTDPAHVGPHELHEVHGLPFEMAIREGRARAAMCAYNQIDRVPVQSDRGLLTGLLRDEYGFDGMVISDLGSVDRLVGSHGVAADQVAATALAFEAGLDVQLSDKMPIERIVEAVGRGQLAEVEVERAASNVLSWKYRLGLVDEPYVDESDVPASLDTAEDRDLARRMAEASIVLLRNDDVGDRPVLPLGQDVRSIAVIGPTADRTLSLLGNYSYPVLDSALVRHQEMMNPSSREGDRPETESPGRAWADDAVARVESVPVVSVLAGIQAAAAGRVDVRYARGCPVEMPERDEIAEAAKLASECDVAVLALGDQSGIFNHATVGEAVDGTTCALPGVQRELVEAVVATGTPTVVVLTHGRPFVLDWMVDAVPAIVTAWFPGEEGGTAVASVLFGDTVPSGKLPVSFPGSAGSSPYVYNRTSLRPGVYYDGSAEPVFPFGHGLSYTSFAYDDLRLSTPEVPTDGTARVSCRVTNSGARSGDEVVQLYLRDPVARTSRPRRELKGFARVHLEAGESRTVTFVLTADRTAIWDVREGWVVEPGAIEIMVGTSSEDIRLAAEVTLTGPVRRVGAERALFTVVEVD